MDIYLDRRSVRQIRLSTQEAIDEGNLDALREAIFDTFTEDQVEEIEQQLDSGDLLEFTADILGDWGGDDVDELLELLGTQFGEAGISLRFESKANADEDGDESEEDEEDGEDEGADDDDEP